MTKYQMHIISLTLSACLAPAFDASSASASQNEGEPSAKDEPTYNHAPVTFWIAPQLGSAGLSSDKLETNVALSLGASAYAKLEGADLGVGASWVTQSMRGAQITAGFNYAPNAAGAQISAGANLADEYMAGVQLAAGFNYGRELEGAQIALVNVGGQIRGAQIGLVNIAGVARGTQIGLVNLAEESTAPVGLFNLIRNGRHHVGLWSSESVPVNFAIKLGGETIYSLLTVGAETSGGKKRWLAGFGFGGHFELDDDLYLDAELLASHVNDNEAWTRETNVLSSLRVLFGYQLYTHLSFFAGPTLNVFVAEGALSEGFGLIRGARLTSEGSDTTVRMWPGLVAGFQI